MSTMKYRLLMPMCCAGRSAAGNGSSASAARLRRTIRGIQWVGSLLALCAMGRGGLGSVCTGGCVASNRASGCASTTTGRCAAARCPTSTGPGQGCAPGAATCGCTAPAAGTSRSGGSSSSFWPTSPRHRGASRWSVTAATSSVWASTRTWTWLEARTWPWRGAWWWSRRWSRTRLEEPLIALTLLW